MRNRVLFILMACMCFGGAFFLIVYSAVEALSVYAEDGRAAVSWYYTFASLIALVIMLGIAGLSHRVADQRVW